MTDIDQIIDTKNKLNRELQVALSSMEKKNDVKDIREKIRLNQAHCPHYSKKYNFTWDGNTCPYCGQEHCVKPLEGWK